MTIETQKTHWLQNPNKNYLGHWDLPNGKPVILTIASAQWEGVTNPINDVVDSKRVIRFQEETNWIKPFICNEVNAQAILNSTGSKFMEDCAGMKIRLRVSQTLVRNEKVDCIRVDSTNQDILMQESHTINRKQFDILRKKLALANRDEGEFLKLMRITDLSQLQSTKFPKVIKRLDEIIGKQSEEEEQCQ